jgi:hypothetical protein
MPALGCLPARNIGIFEYASESRYQRALAITNEFFLQGRHEEFVTSLPSDHPVHFIEDEFGNHKIDWNCHRILRDAPDTPVCFGSFAEIATGGSLTARRLCVTFALNLQNKRPQRVAIRIR